MLRLIHLDQSMEQQAMAPKIIESSSKEKILKDKDIELKAKLDDKKIPTKLHKVSKDLKDTKMKLTSKLSPEIKERVKMTMDSWKAEKIIPSESVKPITEKYFGECVSDPPPRLIEYPFSGTDWDHCNVSYLMFMLLMVGVTLVLWELIVTNPIFQVQEKVLKKCW